MPLRPIQHAREGTLPAAATGRPAVIGLVSASLACLAMAVGLHAHITTHAFQGKEETRIDRIPPVEVLETFPPLLRRMAADVLWIRAIQSYGYHRQTDGVFTALEDHFDALVRVDPTFEQGYAFGGLALAEDGQDSQAGINLLKRGMINLPHSWRLPFDIGFIYYVQLGDASRAAHFFDLASTLPGAPDYVQHFAAFAYLRAGQRTMARAFWLAIYEEAPSEAVKRLAAEALERLQREEDRARVGKKISQADDAGASPSVKQGTRALLAATSAEGV
jgi:hypothetical protein